MLKHKTITVFASLMMVVPVIATAELKPGSVVIYSDGDVEKLLTQNQEWSLWEDQRKRQYKRAYLPYFPVLEYRRFAEQPSGYDQSVPEIQAIALKPFSEKESVQFSLTRKTLGKGSSQRKWSCKHEGTGRYTLRKQILATEEYECIRLKVKKNYIETIREKLSLSYSPELDLVVKAIRTNRYGKVRKVTVERILTPNKATAKRIARAVYKLKNR